MKEVLLILIVLGPFLSVSKLIGDDRTKSLEARIIQLFDLTRLVIPSLFKLGWTLAVLFLFFISIALLSKLIAVGAEVAGDGVLLLVALISIATWHPLMQWQAKYAHRVLQLFCKDWRKSTGDKDPPWPMGVTETQFVFPYVFWIINALPFLILMYAFVIPIITLVLFLILLPFRIAEWLRKKLNPSSSSYFDTLSWLVSLVAVSITVYKY